MNFFDSLMAPLSREHCMIIFYLGIITLFFGVIFFVSGVFNLFDKKSRQYGSLLLLMGVKSFIIYYLYRIAYSICLKAL